MTWPRQRVRRGGILVGGAEEAKPRGGDGRAAGDDRAGLTGRVWGETVFQEYLWLSVGWPARLARIESIQTWSDR